MIVEGNVITADTGMVLTNDVTYSKKVYLSVLDSIQNWREIPEGEVPPDPGPEEEVTDSEALEILLGGAT